MMISMEHYLIVSSIMFFVGIYGFIARKNLLAVLISIELILNSVEINFSVFNRYLYPEHMEGLFFSLFGIAISAAETAVARWSWSPATGRKPPWPSPSSSTCIAWPTT